MTLQEVWKAGQDGVVLTHLSVPTFVRAVGAGPPVIVLHGGPGFAHDYLMASLHPLANRRTLVFYDQPGCGWSGGTPADLTATRGAEHLGELLACLLPDRSSVGALAHSWGCFLALAAHAREGVGFDEGLLIAPVGVTREAWDTAAARLLARVPSDVLADLVAALHVQTETSLAPVLPYYCAPGTDTSDLHLRVRGRTYLSVLESLGRFDHRATAKHCVANLDLLLPRFDFTTPDLLGDLIPACRAVHATGGGHFPFYENPAEWSAVLDKVFR